MIVRKLATQFVVLGSLLMGTMACVPRAQLEIAYTGFNPRLRHDRQPLDNAQLELGSRLDSLRYGPYRTGAAELANPLTPAHTNAAHLPQSDCWWMGLGGDSLRASWEATIEAIGDEDVLEDYHDPEDAKLDLGLCRFNDPETRAPVQAVDDDSGIFPDADCSRLGNGTAITAGGDNNFFRCTTDLAWLEPSLQALGTSSTDGLQRCAQLRAGIGGSPRRIARNTDFYDGLSGGTAEQPSIESCGASRRLVPPAATRYQIEQTGGTVHTLEPMALPIPGALLGRPMQSPSPGVWAWATTRTADPGGSGGARWEENFSPSLQVSKVRFFDLDAAGNRVYLDPPGRPPLCIEDPQAQGGCRWTCAAVTAPDGRLQYDLLATGLCIVGGGPISEVPRVTPTYTKSTAESVALDQPLRWSASFAHPGTPYLELQLITTFEPAALRAEPALTDLGGARVGQYARASFIVDNVGAHPMRIVSVAMDPAHGGNAASNFVLQLPSLPLPVALPVEIVDQGTKERTLQLGDGAESQTTMTVYTDFAHVRVSRRGGGFSSRIGNHTVRDDRGLLLRDVANPAVVHDPLKTPASRTSYALRTLPFTIQPGEAFEVSARGRPGATGDRIGYAKIVGESVLDPAQRVTIWAALKVYGMQGPLISAAPGQLTIVVSGNAIARDRAVLIQNAGDTSGTLGAPTLTAIGGGPIAAGTQLRVNDPYGGGGTLASGDSRVIRVEYLSDCSRNVVGGYRDEDAELRWTTPDGPVAVRIDTAADCVP